MTPLLTTLGTPRSSGGFVLASGDTSDVLQVNDFARHTGWLHGVMTQYAGKGVVLFAARAAAPT